MAARSAAAGENFGVFFAENELFSVAYIIPLLLPPDYFLCSRGPPRTPGGTPLPDPAIAPGSSARSQGRRPRPKRTWGGRDTAADPRGPPGGPPPTPPSPPRRRPGPRGVGPVRNGRGAAEIQPRTPADPLATPPAPRHVPGVPQSLSAPLSLRAERETKPLENSRSAARVRGLRSPPVGPRTPGRTPRRRHRPRGVGPVPGASAPSETDVGRPRYSQSPFRGGGGGGGVGVEMPPLPMECQGANPLAGDSRIGGGPPAQQAPSRGRESERASQDCLEPECEVIFSLSVSPHESYQAASRFVSDRSASRSA